MTRFKIRRTAQQTRSPARRVSTSAPRRAVRLDPELPLLRGWSTERKVAEGVQARIFLVHRAGDAQRRPFAAKVARLSSPEGWPYCVAEQRWRLLREVAVLCSLAEAGCPNVPRVIEHGLETERSQEPWFVMPFYAGGAMWRLAGGEGRWAEAYQGDVGRVLEIAEGLATTLAVMHEREPWCIHRDLNASNVLFARPGGAPILADFGIAHPHGYPDRPCKAAGMEDSASGSSAPWRWRPPELTRAGAEETPAVDVFMLGGLIVESLSEGLDLPAGAYWPDVELSPDPEQLLVHHSTDPRVGLVVELAGRMLASDPIRRPPARAVAHACRSIRRAATGARQRRLHG